ncbi:MAG TPA: SDR family oxidoreductase [Polaromonas sp.]|uniref:dTDP-4-dehydrorhamnose reductase family protein n=1 Tax=Polaromonas sp. TaxID=1869339 RepID=UPI002D40EED8|nr:SDR family oxidoreductase [Polaromonas sp.]HYW56833.1 SDR family oxidoreductase [Polaromonas sp.]
MKVLILGASGMLGNAMLRLFAQSEGYEVAGSVRSERALGLLPEALHGRVIWGVDVENIDSLTRVFARVRPDVVINCVGLIKQLAGVDDPLVAIPINAILPHKIANLCDVAGARFVHISTDCVFSGDRGMYTEGDPCDAKDLYGRSKYLGEVDYPNAITLRTSIIGHELAGTQSLVGWFLSQRAKVAGFRRAIFSGLPTVELARVIRDHVIPHPELHGLYHVSASPINKFDLLSLVAQTYEKDIEIVSDDQLMIDRSLDSTRFRGVTGYKPPDWPELVRRMREFS